MTFAAALIVFLLAAAPAAAEDESTPLPNWSVGEPVACGDTSVASIVAAECLATEDPDAPAPSARLLSASSRAAAVAGPAPESCRYDANVGFYAATEWLTIGSR